MRASLRRLRRWGAQSRSQHPTCAATLIWAMHSAGLLAALVRYGHDGHTRGYCHDGNGTSVLLGKSDRSRSGPSADM